MMLDHRAGPQPPPEMVLNPCAGPQPSETVLNPQASAQPIEMVLSPPTQCSTPQTAA